MNLWPYFNDSRICCLILYALGAISLNAVIIPATNRIQWVTNYTVGVFGGIPNRTNIVWVTGADPTGTNDSYSAIQTALNNATSNSVVGLTNGYYSVSSILNIPNYVTLRGMGRTNTTIAPYGTNGLYQVASSLEDANFPTSIFAGATNGSTNIVTPYDVSEFFRVGDLMRIQQRNTTYEEGLEEPVFSPNQYEYNDLCVVRLTANLSGGSNWSVWPPVAGDYVRNPQIDFISHSSGSSIFAPRVWAGIEGIHFSFTNTVRRLWSTTTLMGGVGNAANCWIKDCEFSWAKNYHVSFGYAANCYFGGNTIRNVQDAGSNHAGLLASIMSGCLIEDNIFANFLFPAIEWNSGFTGNAVVYNYLATNANAFINHNTHSRMNLWEGNMLETAWMHDGYFGSASRHTLFRNSFMDSYTAVYFKRWGTKMQVVGNVLGNPNSNYLAFTQYTNGVPYNVIEMGRPNIGNQNYIGTNPPSPWNFPGHTYEYGGVANGIFQLTNCPPHATNRLNGNFSNITLYNDFNHAIVFQDQGNTNKYWPNDGSPLVPTGGNSTFITLNRSVTVSNGWRVYVTGVTAYQQLQTVNSNTHNIHGNYDAFTKTVTWNPDNPDHTLPASFIYTNGAPSYWGTNRWPAIDPEATPMVASIPSFQRYLGIVSGGGQTTNSGLRNWRVNRMVIGQ